MDLILELLKFGEQALDVSQNTTAGGAANGSAISATNRKLKNQGLGS